MHSRIVENSEVGNGTSTRAADSVNVDLLCRSYTFRFRLGDEFARNTGYNEVGELNNIIIIYPQASVTNFTNPFGCWDYLGYTNPFYGKLQ